MRTNIKLLCKFRQKCREYQAQKECKFSHQGFTKENGYQLPSSLQADCTGKVQTKQEILFQFQKPKSQTLCRFRGKCILKDKGKCGFKHSEENADDKKDENIPNKAEIQCRFGDKCKNQPYGNCLYKHTIILCQLPPKTQEQKSVFRKICPEFVMNKWCIWSCYKLHDFTEEKKISRLFFRKDDHEVKKMMIMQQDDPNKSPLYAILMENRICFGMLKIVNRGQQDNCLMEKQVERQDIQFENEKIQNAWYTKISQNGNSVDLMVCKCSSNLKIVTMSLKTFIDYPVNQQVVSVFSISNYLMILLKSGKIDCLEYILDSNKFLATENSLKERFVFIKKYSSLQYDEEIIAGVTQDNTLCFINKNLLTCKVKLNQDTTNESQKIVDIAINQETSDPTALVLTSKGKLYSINMLTFQVFTMLQPEPDCSHVFSCLAMTRSHIFIAIQFVCILVYKLQKYDKPVGLIGLDSSKWNIQYDLYGNMIVNSENQQGSKEIRIFKVSKN